ncbi:MAG: hypothetical protein ACR2MY_07390 [Candidatus Dormibacteria bacterium]
MTELLSPQHGLPRDGELAGLLRVVEAAVTDADPLSAALLGGPLRLPYADPKVEAAALARLAEAAEAVEALKPCHDADDDADRLALVYGLRRVIAAARPDEPAGPLLVERHLQLRLLRLLDQPTEGMLDLAEVIEAGPSLLLRARRSPARGSQVGGRLALESARRMPALLEACAGAAAEARFEIRARVEAALGMLLQASAEESGWLLKEYLPAVPQPLEPVPADPVSTGFGMSLAELESEAEAALAEAVGDPDGQPDSAVGIVDPAPIFRGGVARAWEVEAEEASLRWGAAPGPSAIVTTAPGWLTPLVPPLSIWSPGALAPGPIRLLVGSPTGGPMGELVSEADQADFRPAACQRAGVRRARLLLPGAELQQGWRAQVRAAGAGPSNWRTELAWRAALALAAIALTRGRASIYDAAGLIAAESGFDADQALLQAMTVAQRPMAALGFIAGRVTVSRLLSSWSPVRLLSEGPLPAAAFAG